MNSPKMATPWTQADKDHWFKEQIIKRSYQDQVASKIEDLKSNFDVVHYGALSLAPDKYPLFHS